MSITEQQAIQKLATDYLDERWQESWGDLKEFDKVALDFAISVEAAIDDCWHNYCFELVARHA